MSLNLLESYQQQVKEKLIQENQEQLHILKILEESWQQTNKRSLFPWFKHSLKTIHVYIYGTVGSGKTYVMDLFYKELKSPKKARFHFHYFIEDIANQLKKLQGKINPMQIIVKELVKNYQVICLDEMMVQDVVQAMILRELIPALMEQQVMLVMTSNIEPQDLYQNGLQRERFMTVIEHIETYAHVMSLSSSVDYRSSHFPMPQQSYFVKPQNEMQVLFESFAKHLHEEPEYDSQDTIQNREVKVLAKTKDLIWFDFKDIATIPRCQRDYLELAKRFKMVFISGIPSFQGNDASLILWIYLIDVFYDAHIKLVLGADVAMDKLYLTGPMQEPFKRTLSRMQEMQSQWYWEL